MSESMELTEDPNSLILAVGSNRRPSVMSKKRAIIALGAASLIYAILPYYAAYSLRDTLEKADKYELERAVDFDSVRKYLKEQINSMLMKEATEDKELSEHPIAAGLALVFVPKIVDYMVDACVTPAGIVTLLNKGTVEKPNDKKSSDQVERDDGKVSIDLRKVQYAFFTNPTTFLVEYDEVRLEFKLRDWWWKLTAIILSDSFLDSMSILKPAEKQVLDMGVRRLSFKAVTGSFVDSQNAGSLFVIQGTVINDYAKSRSFILIKGAILDEKGQVVKRKLAYASNNFKAEEIKSLTFEEIDKAMNNRYGRDNRNVKVQPGGLTPFTIVF